MISPRKLAAQNLTNPETVSIDYDTADRLYFEPLTLEDVLNIIDLEQPEGVILQFGGQTRINLTAGLAAAGIHIWGTAPEAIALAEDRGRFGQLLHELEIDHPAWDLANSTEEALQVAHKIGYPVLVRPSFVLGGRAMAIAYGDASLQTFLAEAVRVSPGNPVLIWSCLCQVAVGGGYAAAATRSCSHHG